MASQNASGVAAVSGVVLMPRPATGQVIERAGKRGTTFAIRFTLPNGDRRQVRLGRAAEGGRGAERRRSCRRCWRMRAAAGRKRSRRHRRTSRIRCSRSSRMSGSRACAASWRRGRWRTMSGGCRHVLPYFGDLPLSAITAQEVDRYRQAKVREWHAAGDAVARQRRRWLSATSINKTLTRSRGSSSWRWSTGWSSATRRKGRNRRSRRRSTAGRSWTAPTRSRRCSTAPRRSIALAGRTPYRRALLATLVFAGLRIDEALSLRWRDVNLPSRTLRVGVQDGRGAPDDRSRCPRSWTSWWSCAPRSGGAPGALVFPTSTGGKQSPSNVR